MEPTASPDFIRDELLHEIFESTVDRQPGSIAIVCGDLKLRYRDVEERANRLAQALRARGVGREDRVAILLPRGEDVYIAILAVLKSGAAYVPLDPEIPSERARFILQDCDAKCLITRSDLVGRLGSFKSLLYMDLDESTIGLFPPIRLTREHTGLSRNNLCYLIYTSGTTGQPKGVQIEHRNVTNLVRAESELYGIRSNDRIFQFASVSFDASVEEIWMAFFHGATLVVGTTEIMRSGLEFAGILAGLNVTVLSCVPTFISMLDQDIPTLRLLIFGGEICPAELAARWQKPGRKIFNTYGPTEATVIATATVLESDRPVTIGRPISNYNVYLMDERGELATPGASGEICIGGEGVARGYNNRPELTREKFIVTSTLNGGPVRVYRSGDMACWNADGELEYLGRLDGQVKIRGFRVELSEIEAVLVQYPGILAAAASVHAATQRIAAYVVLRPDVELDRAAVRAAVAKRLPTYMVPAFLDILPALPVTSSGKIDRKALPEPASPLGENRAFVAPRTDAEWAVFEIWRSVLKQNEISITDNFFLDLEGHSLLAALAVSKLRTHPGFERISVADLYAHPTIESLASLARKSSEAQTAASSPSFHHVSSLTYVCCMMGQALGVLVLAGVYAWQWLGPFLTYGYMIVADATLPRALLWALFVYVVMTPLVLALSIVVKWILLGRIRPGQYPLWGWYYWRFWFVRSIVRAAPLQYLSGTPFINIYYRLMGARIGHEVFIGSHGLSTFDVVSIDDGSSIGTDTNIDGASVGGGFLKIASVTIGRHCFVGNRSSIGSDAVLEDRAALDDLSMLPDGAHILSDELWRGSPASKVGRLEPEERRRPWNLISSVKQLLGIFLFPLVILLGIFPGLMVITRLGHADEGYTFLFGAPFVAISFVVLLCLEVWVLKWLLLGRIRAGRYPIGGSFCNRLWFYDKLMDLSLEVIGTFYTTLYLRPWLSALGARIGPRSEISTIRLTHPDLLTTGPECFLADDVMVGIPRVRSGWITISRTRLGDRVFVGNSAVLPADVVTGNNVLIGVLSIAPETTTAPVPDGTSWFGSPPIHLPSRQKQIRFAENETYRPPRRMVALRLIIEFFRIILPSTIFVVLASLMINVTDIMQDHVGLGVWLLILPALYVVAGLISIFLTLFFKRVLVGRYHEDQKPLWSVFVWRTELVTGVYENLCVLFFMDLLKGTPFIVWVLRMFGAKIGKRCYVDTTQFTEFDLIDIGDDVSLNDEASLQTHLFEDRVMKMGPVSIGDRCSVGAMTTVLYDTRIGEDVSLGELSLLMKGESLPAGTKWSGIPAQSQRSQSAPGDLR